MKTFLSCLIAVAIFSVGCGGDTGTKKTDTSKPSTAKADTGKADTAKKDGK
jgi:hypothetical protein